MENNKDNEDNIHSEIEQHPNTNEMNDSQIEDSIEYDSESNEDDEWFDASHPLLGRFQLALKNRLQRMNERLDDKLIAKSHDLKNISKERENIGVELYTKQQELASSQLKFEQLNITANEKKNTSLESESDLNEYRSQNKSLLNNFQMQIKKQFDLQKTLDILNENIQNLKIYDENMKKDIENQKRNAYAIEERMQSLENKKSKQDLLITHLEKKIRNLENQSSLYAIQLKIQEKETLVAKEILRESLSAINIIQFEKLEYVQKWKSSIISLKKRDEILVQTQKMFNSLLESIKLSEIEIYGCTKDICTENDKIQFKQILYEKLKYEKENLEKKITQVNKDEVILGEKILQTKQRISDINNAYKKCTQDKINIEQNISCIKNKSFKNKMEINAIEDELRKNLTIQKDTNYSTEYMLNDMKSMQKKIHTKEFSVENIKNQMIKIEFQIINHSKMYDDSHTNLHTLENSIHTQNEIIVEYDKKHKKSVEQICKKTNILDRLNSKFEQITNKNNSASDINKTSSNLENTIVHLEKQISSLVGNCTKMEEHWVFKQTELVFIINENFKNEDFVTKLNSKEIILGQKKIRQMLKINLYEEDIKKIEKLINNQTLDKNKLNLFINKYNMNLKENELENKNLMNKIENQHEINDEILSEMKEKLKSLMMEKTKINEDIFEYEKHILLWERKIELQLETNKNMIDPNFGKSEISDMKQEIHRMEIRLSQIKIKQEKIIKDMEISVDKRETISLRNLGKNQNICKKNMMKKQIRNLKNELKSNLREKKSVLSVISKSKKEESELSVILNEISDDFCLLNIRRIELQKELILKNIIQKVNVGNISMMQKQVKDMKRMIEKENKNDVDANEKQMVSDKYAKHLEKQKSKLLKLKAVVQSLIEQYPQFEDWFQILFEQLNDESANVKSEEENV